MTGVQTCALPISSNRGRAKVSSIVIYSGERAVLTIKSDKTVANLNSLKYDFVLPADLDLSDEFKLHITLSGDAEGDVTI